ncbi:zinc finger protein 271-like [Sitophilus oryzae]|uniref:Zinc finger protein 271-like n=1 Tax=Sitophilus oryzae TaxID=7048 RepID=A0A6J2XP13_SITOR|nr:zinc finger protein 271-like [Sitophilus oryzae]
MKYNSDDDYVDHDVKYQCEKCCQEFTTKALLNKHKKKCDTEKVKGTTKNSENSIVKLESGKKLYLCKKCPMVFPMYKLLREHRKEHIQKDYVEEHSYTFDELQELFICNTCSAEFKDEDEAEKHTKAHGEIFDCPLCENKFQTLFQLGKHLKVTHNDDDQFTCPLCADLKFSNASLFMKHINIKHQQRFSHNCQTCGRGFHSKTLCEEHSNVHLGLKPFSCVVCGAKFAYSKSVTTHQLKAHRVEILGKDHATECTYCKNRFVSIASLQRHINQAHATPKPKEKSHLCDICGKGFAKRNKMVVHQRVHTGDKPYECNYCDKRFAKSGERNCHQRIHTGERPYSCEYCGKRFRQTAPFKVHIRTHTGERPYVCDVCLKGYTTNQGLRLHRKNCGIIFL